MPIFNKMFYKYSKVLQLGQKLEYFERSKEVYKCQQSDKSQYENG